MMQAMRTAFNALLFLAVIIGFVLLRPAVETPPVIQGRTQDDEPSLIERASIIVRDPVASLRSIFLPDPLPGERVTVLILGKAGQGWTAGELTDTILLAVLNPPTGRQEEGRGTLLSLPRDLLAQLPSGAGVKINSLWLIGKQDARARGDASVVEQSELIREAVENITGVPVDEVIVVDVAAVERGINLLGGIAVNVQKRIDDPRFPTPGGGVERFIIEPGFQVLDGKTAVQYARTRRTKEGDFGRMRRQQLVLEATIAKARGLQLTEDFGKIVTLFETLRTNVETTLDVRDIRKLAALVRDIPFANLRTFALETLGPEPLLKSAGVNYAFMPRAGIWDYTEIHAAIAELIE